MAAVRNVPQATRKDVRLVTSRSTAAHPAIIAQIRRSSARVSPNAAEYGIAVTPWNSWRTGSAAAVRFISAMTAEITYKALTNRILRRSESAENTEPAG